MIGAVRRYDGTFGDRVWVPELRASGMLWVVLRGVDDKICVGPESYSFAEGRMRIGKDLD